jgi:uroporphyrinogen-III synthase
MDMPLTNKRIALAEARELDLLAGMLEREGATVIRAPLITIKDAPDAAPVVAWLQRLIARPPDDVIFYTGEGLRRLLGFADRAGLRDDFLSALKKARKITRGPKPVKALREVGLSPDITTDIPTTDGLIALLESENLQNRKIGVQIYGQEANPQLMAFLDTRGAVVDAVAPYIYASDTDDAHVQTLILDMAAGKLDAVVFTSSPQIRRLEDVAEKFGLQAELKTGLERIKIAAVGPVVAHELAQRGIHTDAMPENSFTMKPLVKSIRELFATMP